MTPEELLRPRVIIENKWPNCPYAVGDILIQDGDYYWVVDDISWYSKIPKQDVELYPYLMRPLEWWEERKVEDMPEYIKEASSIYKIGEFIKVAEWEMESDEQDIACFRDEKDNHFTWVRAFIPATEAEYLQYVKTLNQQS